MIGHPSTSVEQVNSKRDVPQPRPRRVPSRAPLLILSVLGCLASSCSSGRTVVYAAPSNETIRSGTEMTYGGEGQFIYVVNHSSVPIVITGLRLTECENIRNRCETMRLNVIVHPGRRENLVTVRSANPDFAHSFRFTYTWEPASDR